MLSSTACSRSCVAALLLCFAASDTRLRGQAADASPEVNPATTNTPTAPHRSIRDGNTNTHWAYVPVAPVALTLPKVKNTRWARSRVDRFVLARLEQAGLKPTREAEAFALARRLYFDLTGLPPTAAELEAFDRAARQNRETAVVALVDRLLQSPRFGEHWGRRWLDVARYGESVTLRGFIFREAWRYRDYVIDALNEDRPFDDFVREQIAGDLYPDESLAVRQRRLIATTFLALGNTNLEEQDKKQLDMDVVDEQLDTLGKTFLAQTIGCARCHDHKFDPIPTRDYYAMAGILKNAPLLKHANVSEWLESPLPLPPAEEASIQQSENAIATLEQKIKIAREKSKQVGGKDSRAVAGPAIVSPASLAGTLVDSDHARPIGDWKHSTYSKRFIGDGYLHDSNEGKGTKTLSFAPENLAAGRYEVRFAYDPAASRATDVPVTVYHADGETVVHVDQRETPPVDGRFVSLGQFRFEANGFANVLVATADTKGFVTADAVQFLPADSPSPPARPGPGAAPALTTKEIPPTSNERETLAALEAQLKALRQKSRRRPMVMTVREATTAEDCPIHVRGSVHQTTERVPRGFLSVVSAEAPRSPLPGRQSGRRELAEWLVSPSNPLTARVYVNRVWAGLFGEGLVRSVDNFGTTGDFPTHPELLDDLAARFVSGGWSTKKLVRELVLSATYQQAARVPEGPDPENRLWSGVNRRRLTAEQLRDAMLVLSGQLDLTVPRGPTYPSDRTADFGFVSEARTRSVYLPVFRNALPEVFEAFDFAPSSTVIGRRHVSTGPGQALFLMNHPFAREQAAAAARRLSSSLAGETLAHRIRKVYRETLGRNPTVGEEAVAAKHLQTIAGEIGWTELLHALMASADFRYVE